MGDRRGRNQPGNSENIVIRSVDVDFLFSLELGCSVSIDGIGRIVLVVGKDVVAMEHVVSGEVE